MRANDHTDAALADESRHIKKPPTVEAVEGREKAEDYTAKTEDAGVFGQHSVGELREKSVALEHRLERLICFFAVFVQANENQKGHHA